MAWKILVSIMITAGLVPATLEASTPGRGIYEKMFQGTEFELKNSGRICPADMVDRMEKGLDDRYFREFFRKHGVKIITELNRLRTTGCCCMAFRLSSVTKNEYTDIVRYLDRALDRYPPGFVKQYVQRIVVAGKITAKGHPVGGYTKVGSGIVFLSTGRSGISSLGPIFHHEFNHVLYGYANQAHAAEAFAMGTEKGFRYGRGGIDYILSGNGGCSPSDDWFAKGFACNYGTAAVEEDYATLAGYALSDWENFSKRALKHEKIARKFMGLIQFYNSFDSRMDEFFWTGKAGYGSDGPYTGNISPLFFLDDLQVTGPRRRPEYRISDLLSKEPSLDYTRELKEKTRREGYNSSAPQVINDTVKLYRVSLFPPGEKKNRISMLVIPGMRMNFQPGEHMRVSNYWAIAVQEVALQPLRAFTGGDGGISGKKGADHSSDERIFFIEDVLDRERDRKYLKPNAPVRTIYLSTVQGKSGGGTFSTEELRKRAAENWKNPFGFLIINDTLQDCTVKLYRFKDNGKLYRTFRLAPNSREAPGLVNSMDAIGISR